MDYQNRVGNKQGGGGLASSLEANAARRARVRELLSSSTALIDTDPYVFKNHLGLLECKLCYTTHVSESSFVTHVQGKKHQTSLMRRQHRLEQQQPLGAVAGPGISHVEKRQFVKIGTPGYQISKIRHPLTEQMGLTVVVKFSKLAPGIKPLYRFMSYFEQHVDSVEETNEEEVHKYQYLVISGEPYENICIKVPNQRINRSENESVGLWDYWDEDVREYYLQFFFEA